LDFNLEKYGAMPNFMLTVVRQVYEFGMIIKGVIYS
jgi:hypothetical protein